MLSLTSPATSEARSHYNSSRPTLCKDGFPESKMELTAWVERTRSERGVAIIGLFGGEVTTRLRAGKIPIFPIQVPGIFDTYVLSQNIPEPGA